MFYIKYVNDIRALYRSHARLSDAAKLSILPVSSITISARYLPFTTNHII